MHLRFLRFTHDHKSLIYDFGKETRGTRNRRKWQRGKIMQIRTKKLLKCANNFLVNRERDVIYSTVRYSIR